MTLRQYLLIMTISTALCWLAWGLIIINVDPFAANVTSFGFFYLSLFLSLLGTLAIGFFIILRLIHDWMTPLFRQVGLSFKLSFIFSTLLVGLLYILGRGWLRMWNVVILLAANVSFLIFLRFRSKDQQILLG